MCQTLAEIEPAILRVTAAFDPRAISPAQASQLVRRCSEIEGAVASMKAMAASRAAEGGTWRRRGFRSAADQLACDGRMSPSSAARALRTGKQLSSQGDVAAAALAGKLSFEQAAAVAHGAAAAPHETRSLIAFAAQSSLPELHEKVAAARARGMDLEQRRSAIHAKRSLRRWTDLEGVFHGHLLGNPQDGHRIWGVLDPIRRLLLERRNGTARIDAVDFDALMILAAAAAGERAEIGLEDLRALGLFPGLADLPDVGLPLRDGSADAGRPNGQGIAATAPRPRLAGSPARILVRVDLDALLRGVAMEGELCELVGSGAVPVSLVEELAANGNTFVVGVLTRGKQVHGVYHHRRRPSAHQSSALDFLFPECAAAGCHARGGLQTDHREDWARTKFTAFDLLDRLCPHHHRLKTRHGWALVRGTGKRAFVRPDDPRHPRRQPSPSLALSGEAATRAAVRQPRPAKRPRGPSLPQPP